MAALIARETEQTLEKVMNDIERDFWMPATAAVSYGLASKIIQTEKELRQAQTLVCRWQTIIKV